MQRGICGVWWQKRPAPPNVRRTQHTFSRICITNVSPVSRASVMLPKYDAEMMDTLAISPALCGASTKAAVELR